MKREMTIIGSTRKYKSNKLKVKNFFFKKKAFCSNAICNTREKIRTYRNSKFKEIR